MSDIPLAQPISIFCAYSRKDERLLDKLHEHLALLKRQRNITVWHDRRIEAGLEWEAEVDDKINSCQVIVLLISASFVNSDYCYGNEMEIAMRRHQGGEARVIPIILRPCDWHEAPFGPLQALPKDGKPVTEWRNRDAAWHDIAAGIRRAVGSLSGERDGHNLVPSGIASA